MTYQRFQTMKQALFIAPILALGLAGAPALAGNGEAQVEAPEEARIPFVDHGGIRDWRVGDSDTIYIQDRHRDWYEATLMTPAIGLRSAWAIGFQTRGVNTFDRFSNIVVDGWRYPLASLVRIDGPPSRDEERA